MNTRSDPGLAKLERTEGEATAALEIPGLKGSDDPPPNGSNEGAILTSGAPSDIPKNSSIERALAPVIALSSVALTLGAATLYLMGSVYSAYVDSLGVPTGLFPAETHMILVWGFHIGTMVVINTLIKAFVLIAITGAVSVVLWKWLDQPSSPQIGQAEASEIKWYTRYLAPVMLHFSIVLVLFAVTLLLVMGAAYISSFTADQGEVLADSRLKEFRQPCALESPCRTYRFGDQTYVGRPLLSNEKLLAVILPATKEIVILDMQNAGKALMTIVAPSRQSEEARGPDGQ